MSKRSNTSENAKFQGSITITNGDLEDGNLYLGNALYSDNILSNTDNTDIDIDGVKIYNKTIVMSPPTEIDINRVSNNSHVFFIENGLLKSKKSDNTLTTYQPSTTKGDIVVHNGITQTRLPAGPDRHVISMNSRSDTGVSWVKSHTLTEPCIEKLEISTNYSITIDKVYGTFYAYIYTGTCLGLCVNYFVCKSRDNIYGHVVRLNFSRPTFNVTANITAFFNPYSSFILVKNYEAHDINYNMLSNYKCEENTVELSGTDWYKLDEVYPSLTGAYVLSIKSNFDGPACQVFICKSSASYNTAAITYINSSPSEDESKIVVRWLQNDYIEIKKTSINNDGEYDLIINSQNSYLLDFTLTGTTPYVLKDERLRIYKNKSFLIRLYSLSIQDSPCSIFTTSKNDNTTHGSLFSVTSPGKDTLEKIIFSWPANSTPNINKTGNNYDGLYQLEVFDLGC